MKVALINAYKDVFKKHLEITQDYHELYKYECLKNFQDNWDLGELDLYTTFDKSFKSKISGRLWGGSKNSAKSLMLKFIEMDKEFVRSMFRDLYNEDKDIAMRVNRFNFHCEQLLDQLMLQNKKINDHQQSEDIVAMYLAFQYPQTYNLFSYGAFEIMMNRLELKDIPQSFELDRYFKLCKGLYTMLTKDEELLELHKKHFESDIYYVENTMLIVHDFLKVCSKEPRIEG